MGLVFVTEQKRVGIRIRQVGIGDGVQFTSLPENYFRAKGEKLIDLSEGWFFDHNPYVERGTFPLRDEIELWNYPPMYSWPKVRGSVYLSNAEVHASVLGVKNPVLIRPRLYKHEDPCAFRERKQILFHPYGKSHGALPESVIQHVVEKYGGTGQLVQIGLPSEPTIKNLVKLTPSSMWDLALLISRARMFIGIDSGPSWIAACYPDVVTKKVRTKFQFALKTAHNWVPLEEGHIHSFWDDQNLFNIYHCLGDDDVGFMQSFRKL